MCDTCWISARVCWNVRPVHSPIVRTLTIDRNRGGGICGGVVSNALSCSTASVLGCSEFSAPVAAGSADCTSRLGDVGPCGEKMDLQVLGGCGSCMDCWLDGGWGWELDGVEASSDFSSFREVNGRVTDARRPTMDSVIEEAFRRDSLSSNDKRDTIG